MNHSGYGFHYGPCRSGPGIGLGSVAAVVAVVIAAAKRHAIEHGADEAVHILFVAAVIAACVVAVTVVAAVVIRLSRTARVVGRRADEVREMTSETSHRVIRLDPADVAAIEPARPTWPHAPQLSRDRDEVSR